MRIKSSYRDMSPKEKQIADYILKNIKLVSRSTISDISRNLGIADSTFYQFTKKLGYEGFKDFKINLLTEEFDPEISIHEKISKNGFTVWLMKSGRVEPFSSDTLEESISLCLDSEWD